VEPEKFSERGQGILKRAMKPPEPFKEEEWKDYKTAVERLNAPELLDFYINNNFNYRMDITGCKNAKYVFSIKYGDCDDLANFGKIALRRAGYSVFGRKIRTGFNPEDGHMGSGIILKDKQYLLVVNFTKMGNRMSGPYEKISDLDNNLVSGKRIIGASWW